MAIITSHAIIYIPRHTFMLLIHICLVMFMAVDTAKYVIVPRVGMAFRAGVPLALVFSGIYGEILAIMVECGGHPYVLGVAQCTFS